MHCFVCQKNRWPSIFSWPLTGDFLLQPRKVDLCHIPPKSPKCSQIFKVPARGLSSRVWVPKLVRALMAFQHQVLPLPLGMAGACYSPATGLGRLWLPCPAFLKFSPPYPTLACGQRPLHDWLW